jgi:hypothetical protein
MGVSHGGDRKAVSKQVRGRERERERERERPVMQVGKEERRKEKQKLLVAD